MNAKQTRKRGRQPNNSFVRVQTELNNHTSRSQIQSQSAKQGLVWHLLHLFSANNNRTKICQKRIYHQQARLVPTRTHLLLNPLREDNKIASKSDKPSKNQRWPHHHPNSYGALGNTRVRTTKLKEFKQGETNQNVKQKKTNRHNYNQLRVQSVKQKVNQSVGEWHKPTEKKTKLSESGDEVERKSAKSDNKR